ncbi:hypothetical protein RB195_004613 [Necator americanus]|uniref:DUF5641 domain-containing protein n=1 Tax=Necator americanus TaxID=51031 RepID=A0ABR1BM97_NECAM
MQATRNRTLLMDDLHTPAKESEAICNSRPLTYVNDQEDFLPLRPVDFIRPTVRLSSPRLLNEDNEWKSQYTTKDNLIKDWRFGLQLLETFWNRWQVEYLTSLRERQQISHPYPRIHHNDKPANGEYVLIQDDNNKRGMWKIGQICGSSDGYQRSVQIRLPSRLIITRPINLVSRFEITSNSTTQEHTSTVPTNTQNESTERRFPSPTHHMVTRPKARRQQLSLPLFISIMTALPQCIITASSRCPEELTLDKKIIYATPCVTKGIAVAVYSKADLLVSNYMPTRRNSSFLPPIKESTTLRTKMRMPKMVTILLTLQQLSHTGIKGVEHPI